MRRRCEVAPCVVVHQNPVGNATWTGEASRGAQAIVLRGTSYIDYAQYRKAGGYKLIADCLAGKRTREEITKMMEDSGLRGLGGAGFPAGRKWRLVAAEPEPRVMAVNIDEGEPGTFKDRWYLERDPHRFLEGMLVAAWCAGGRSGSTCGTNTRRRDPRQESEEASGEKPAPCLRSTCGAGAYICGEESAMIESIEGKRGMPRLRPRTSRR